jgi:hypothetical protein
MELNDTATANNSTAATYETIVSTCKLEHVKTIELENSNAQYAYVCTNGSLYTP